MRHGGPRNGAGGARRRGQRGHVEQFLLPGAPSVPAPRDLPASVPATGLPAAAPKTIWGFFGLSKANLAGCKEKLCGSQVGKLLNSGLSPLSSFTGGVIPNGFCPTLPPPPPGSDLAGPAGPNGAQSVAAAVMQDQATAPARIAAIEYLATVDCHYWPEATAALIGRLRGDRVECVRFAAAKALGSGCCCTSKTVEALANVLADKPRDNFPSENSERVKATAFLPAPAMHGLRGRRGQAARGPSGAPGRATSEAAGSARARPARLVDVDP